MTSQQTTIPTIDITLAPTSDDDATNWTNGAITSGREFDDQFQFRLAARIHEAYPLAEIAITIGAGAMGRKIDAGDDATDVAVDEIIDDELESWGREFAA